MTLNSLLVYKLTGCQYTAENLHVHLTNTGLGMWVESSDALLMILYAVEVFIYARVSYCAGLP